MAGAEAAGRPRTPTKRGASRASQRLARSTSQSRKGRQGIAQSVPPGRRSAPKSRGSKRATDRGSGPPSGRSAGARTRQSRTSESRTVQARKVPRRGDPSGRVSSGRVQKGWGSVARRGARVVAPPSDPVRGPRRNTTAVDVARRGGARRAGRPDPGRERGPARRQFVDESERTACPRRKAPGTPRRAGHGTEKRSGSSRYSRNPRIAIVSRAVAVEQPRTGPPERKREKKRSASHERSVKRSRAQWGVSRQMKRETCRTEWSAPLRPTRATDTRKPSGLPGALFSWFPLRQPCASCTDSSAIDSVAGTRRPDTSRRRESSAEATCPRFP
jgi:hypothetical protein